MTRRALILATIVLTALLGLAGPAWAHVDLEPTEALAGSTTMLTFSFHHGKDGTATTGLEVQLPAGAEVVDTPPVEGWTASVTDADPQVVSWSGGSVADGVEAAFPVVVRLPAEAGVALFPTIQTTEAGELAWIGEDEGESEDAEPAPRLTLVANPDATTTTEEPSTTTTPTTAAETTTTNDLPGTALEAQQRDDGTSSGAPWVIGSGIAAAVAIAVGGSVLKRRMR